jgi:hypothetical protein
MEETNVDEISFDDIEFEAFSEKELASLNTFHDQVTKILNSRLVKNELLKFHLQGNNKDNVFEVTGSCPDDEEAAHVLMIVRTFLQKSNQTRIDMGYILSILKNRSANSKTRASFDSLDKYESYWKVTGNEVNGKKITSMELFNCMIYADKFHTDGTKREFIDKLGLLEPTKNAMFYNVVIQVIKFAKLIDSVIVNAILKGVR